MIYYIHKFKFSRLSKLSAVLRLISNYVYDVKRFLQSSSIGQRVNTKAKFEALITKEYHRIEKGLALKNSRVGFAPSVVRGLLSKLQKYQKKYGLDETGQIALNVLFAYYEFNLEHGFKDEKLGEEMTQLKEKIPKIENPTSQGGIFKVSRQEIITAAKLDLRAFFQSRYSIRQFAPEQVDISLIEIAIKMAQKTPSVCNRQSSKVYVFSSNENKKKVLSYQNGNRGFGDQASQVLVVTSDLGHFFSIAERNQCWIDGGMFAMSLVYALHSLGLGTCCLNWCVEYKTDQALKKAVGISNSESIIMMIGVGHLPEEFSVAQSSRKNLNEVLIAK